MGKIAGLTPADQELIYSHAIKQRFGFTNKEIDALKKTQKEVVEQRKRQEQEEHPLYEQQNDKLRWNKYGKDGQIPINLTNFSAKIVRNVTMDDGVEAKRYFEVETHLKGKKRSVKVPASDFDHLGWVPEELGPEAIVYPGGRTQAPIAIRELSNGVPEKRVYIHTGWTQHNDQWIYLNAGGPIGPDGPVSGVAVQLSGALTHYALPTPPTGPELKKAVQASLRILEVAPDEIIIPLYAAIFRSVLGGVDFSVSLSGRTGAGKSELSALIQQHFGSGMDARHLPASWSSTENSLEELAFLAKDVGLVIDDFAPAGSRYDIDGLHKKADRVLRAQGNLSGRGRMNQDLSLRPPRPPRGLIISTGEAIPRGQSLQARMLILELPGADVSWEVLTECQRDARSGHFAQALAAFIQWLAGQYGEIRKQLKAEIDLVRDRLSAMEVHKRTTYIAANLIVGIDYFFRFIEAKRVLTKEESEALRDRCEKAIIQACASQDEQQRSSDPVDRFMDLVQEALATGKAYLGNSEYYEFCLDHEISPRGQLIGWLDGDNVYLIPDVACSGARALVGRSVDSLSISRVTLCRRLEERGLLVGHDQGRLTVRRKWNGTRLRVLHLHRETVLGEEAGQAGQVGQEISDLDPLGWDQ
jgi:hypothetical protein